MSKLSTRSQEQPKNKKTPDNSLHTKLCLQGKKWLSKTIGCRLAISEMYFQNPAGEIADVVGWKSGYSILIEAKTSRSDFLVDKKKIFRECPEMGMGSYRLFLCPPGIIKPSDLPENWGLLYYHEDRENKIERVVCFKGNIVDDSENLKRQLSNYHAERNLLLSYTCRKDK